ncbi:phosphodiesterase [Herbiconiux sp. CPCC 205716]|uniref:Phosphodiesterase n=1 Tax=Herbiconiux gentiana TaxID=2970912 RepID=A0ABT2GE66_9MICO|nr:phosphodiesterase [Herbiconiux gentiana]MCS5714477.1 phosphodiesterase [Herbiconiux gentiana]
MGQYGVPGHTIVHISDTHFLAGERALYGAVDTDAGLTQALRQLEASGMRPELFVFTGDIADLGEEDAYRRIRGIVEPAAERLGAQVLWVMGNHDDRARLRVELLDEAAATEPVVASIRLGGLRVIALDTSVPGYHHGELAAEQLDWLRGELAEPAPEGTVLALHHPPIPTTIPLMPILELQRQDELARVIEGSDVRAVLGGHLHYSTHSVFAGVPVSVAAATCYTMDMLAPRGRLVGLGGGQSFSIVQVYDDRIVHSMVPVGEFPVVSGFDNAFVERMAELPADEQLEAFSKHVAPPA